MNSPQSNTRSSRTLLVILSTIGVFAIIVGISIVAIMFFLVHSVSGSLKNFSSLENLSTSSSKTQFFIPQTTSNYIAGIKLVGEINTIVADNVIQKLQAAQDDPHVVGILFDVSSSGGSVVPSQQIYDTVKEVAQKKPIVVYVREMAASGAYYSIAPASKIVATRGSLIGSIGVIMNGFEAEQLFKFLKVTPFTIKTGELKDTGSPTRSFTNADKQYLQDLIFSTREQFASDVKMARKTTDDTMKFMSDGRVVLAPQALSLKLIDILGSRDTALSTIVHLAKLQKKPELYYYDDIQSFSEIFTKKIGSELTNITRQSISNVIEGSKNSLAQIVALP